MESGKHITTDMKRIALWLASAAVSSGVTFLVCEQRHDASIAALQREAKQLEKAAFESRVTQRVSEQMEDIAFQQKSISDRQRELAERQSRIAEIERGKAETERGLALVAERRAVASAAQADSMRRVAERQTELARHNLAVAVEARAHADTLFFQSLGNSLAQSAITQIYKDIDLARLLAYASWHYTNTYAGNRDQQNVYTAVLHTSNSVERINTILKGNVRAIHIVTADNRKWAVGVTDCGELFCYGYEGQRIVHNIRGNLVRDMATTAGGRAAVLSADGGLLLCNYQNAVTQGEIIEAQNILPPGKWKRLLAVDGGRRLVAMSDNSIAWIDAATLQLRGIVPVDASLTAMGCENGSIHVFGKGGSHYIADKDGNVAQADLTAIEEDVTYYYYDAATRQHIVGQANGNVAIVGEGGKIARILTGHGGPVTHIAVVGSRLVTTSYDHSIRLCNLKNLDGIPSYFTSKFDKWPMTFAIDEKESVIWVGNEGGNVNKFCFSVFKNASATQALISREFTTAEWQFYIGDAVKYRTFGTTASKPLR